MGLPRGLFAGIAGIASKPLLLPPLEEASIDEDAGRLLFAFVELDAGAEEGVDEEGGKVFRNEVGVAVGIVEGTAGEVEAT